MPKIIPMLIVFLREMVFDSKEEYDVSSPKFSIKKVAVFTLLLGLSFTSTVLFGRVVALAQSNIALQETLDKHQEKINQCESSDVKNTEQVSLVKDNPRVRR